MIIAYTLVFTICFINIEHGDSVLYPPSFVFQPPKDAIYQKLEALMLRCVATGNPRPEYIWIKNKNPFNLNINVGRYTRWPNEGTLIFAFPNDDDDGIYQCIAKNDLGVAYSTETTVRRAEIQDFKIRVLERLSVREGDNVKLFCHVPLSFPVPIIAWQKIKNGIPELLKESSKYVTDVDGNLYITAVSMDDNQAEFKCTAFNQRMRITKIDSPYKLDVIPGQSQIQVSILFRTVRNIKGRVGERIIIRCILAGNPAPTYTWSVKNQNKNLLERPNFSTDAGGAILIIDPVRIDDQDIYECKGDNTNTLRPIILDYQVDVEMLPKLTVKLSDANVPYNGSHQFKCEAIGIPPPIITWSVNGKGVDTYLNGKNKRKVDNTIILTNLELTDKAVFQCNASNAIGSDYSNGYINVLQDKPEFIVGPQPTLVKAENMPVSITCQTFSAPKAIVTWMKDNVNINGGRYAIQDNGDLLISKLITADSGNYSCNASNLYGSVSGFSMLYVRQRTELMIRPINTWVYFGQEIKFVCTAKTDRLETQNLKIVWYKDNSEIRIGYNERTNTNLQDNSLIISGAETTDTGMYTCNATNGLDFDVAYASLIVQSRPHTPIGISAECSKFANSNEALVSWNPGADNYAPIISYMVEYSTQHDPDAWYEVQRVIKPQGGTGDTVEVKVAMKPDIDYKFRVRALNRVGMSEPSDPTQNRCYLLPRPPSTNPAEVFLYGTTPKNLVIQWTPMTYVEHCGPKLGYEISVKCLTCSLIPNLQSNTTFISNWDQNIVTYYNFQLGALSYEMESFQEFEVSIRSKNEMGFSTQPSTVSRGFSGDGSPSIKAKDLVMTVGTPIKGAVPLTWTVIAEKDIRNLVNGFFRGYRIEWCLDGLPDDKCDASTQYQDVILRTQKLPVLFGNKRRKRSANDDAEEENEERKDELHKYDTKYRQVIPDGLETPVNFQILQRRKRAALNEKVDWNYGSNLTVKLTMIPGNTPIKIWLRVLNTLYTSERSDPPIKITTFEDTPGPVINFRVLTMGINHVLLQWEKPVETNGVITGYRLAWREIIGLELGYMTTYPDLTNPDQLQFQMSGLKAQTYYRILIWALTSQGSGTESFVDAQTQPAYIAPNSPRFTVTSVVNNTVNVTFAPSDVGVKGSVFYAQYRKIGQYRWDESEPEYIRTWIFLSNLDNDTDYEIRIVATNGAGMATPSIIGTFHTHGRLDPTRPVQSNAIWIVVVILMLIFMVLLFIFMLFYREKQMENMLGKEVKDPNMYSQPKLYDSLKQSLFVPSQMSSSVLSGPVNAHPEVQSSQEDSMNGSFVSHPSGNLIDNDEDVPPVYYQNPRIKKHKHKRPIIEDSENENNDAII